MALSNFSKTKIVSTVGPAVDNKESLKALAEAGVNVFRLNFSHGTHEDHGERIKMIHTVNAELGTNVAILCDLQGPKIRVGKVEPKDGTGKEFLAKGDTVIFTTDESIKKPKHYYISYKTIAQDIDISHRVLVDDGKLELKVLKTNNVDTVELEVMNDAFISSNKGVNLPDTAISIPSLTEKDSRDLKFILTQDIHFIALSFVRSGEDMIHLRKLVGEKNHTALLVAKVEKPEAIVAIDDIIDESDAIMVARGDLGVELPFEQTPVMQKMIISKCNAKAKPVIVATQMMESMIENPVPTRAEVSDVANAVCDGADAVMLSGETATGKYPVRVVNAMKKVVTTLEQQNNIYNRTNNPEEGRKDEDLLASSICKAVCEMSNTVSAKAIIGTSKSGYTAVTVSSLRPNANIYVFTTNKALLNQSSLVWGVRAFYYDKETSTDETITDLQSFLKEKGLIEAGDIVINTGSMPIAQRGSTNTIKVSTIA